MTETECRPTWDELPELLTVEELAKFLRTSRNWTYEQCRGGIYRPAVTKLGRAIRIRRDTLRAIIEQGGVAS